MDVKLVSMGEIVFVMFLVISFNKAPINCSAAHIGALTILPIRVFKNLPIVSVKPPNIFSKRQYILSDTFLIPSEKGNFSSEMTLLLVKFFICFSIAENISLLIFFVIPAMTLPIFFAIRLISPSRLTSNPVAAST